LSKKNNSTNFFNITIILTIVQLASLSFLKYYLNDVSILSYRIDYIGNILNITFSFILLLGVVVLKIKQKNFNSARHKFLVTLLLLSIILLILVFLSVKVFTYDENAYLFSFQIKKVYTGFFFILSEVIILYSINYVWGLIFAFDKLYELRTLIRTSFMIILLLIFSTFYVWNVKRFNENIKPDEHYDYAMIPGAAVWKKEKPSPIFEGRIRKAFELYQEKKIDKIILTGSNAPGEISEAEAAFKLLLRLGVNDNDMIIEKKTSTTTEQIKFMKDFGKNLGKENIMLIISDSFHLPRILEISKFFCLSTNAIASDYKLSFSKTVFYRLRESVALLLFWLFAI